MSLTEENKNALASFCHHHRKIEMLKNNIKEMRKELSKEKKSQLEKIHEFLKLSESTIYHIPSNEDDLEEEDFEEKMPMFVRLKNVNSLCNIDSEILKKALQKLDEECVRSEIINIKKRKRQSNNNGDLRVTFLQAIMSCISKERSTPKVVVDFSKSNPRGVKKESIPEANEELVNLVKEVVTLKSNIKRGTKKTLKNLEDELEDQKIAEENVHNFMRENDKKDFRLNVQVEGERVPYFIRRRVITKKSPVSVKEVKGYISEALEPLFETFGDSEEILYDKLEMFKNTVLQHLLLQLEKREDKVEEKVLLHRGVSRSVSKKYNNDNNDDNNNDNNSNTVDEE